MAKKQTSPRLSSSAARLLAKLPKRGLISVSELIPRGGGSYYCFPLPELDMSVSVLRSICASALAQDENRGQEPKKAKRRRGLR